MDFSFVNVHVKSECSDGAIEKLENLFCLLLCFNADQDIVHKGPRGCPRSMEILQNGV